MVLRQKQNRLLCVNNKAENQVKAELDKIGGKWTRQAIWGIRLYDFWNSKKGIAIE